MTPAMLALIIGLVEEAIKLYPSIADEIKAITSKPDPTPADWLALKERVLALDFSTLAPDVKLTADAPDPTTPIPGS
jgi:hypothetical protein